MIHCESGQEALCSQKTKLSLIISGLFGDCSAMPYLWISICNHWHHVLVVDHWFQCVARFDAFWRYTTLQAMKVFPLLRCPRLHNCSSQGGGLKIVIGCKSVSHTVECHRILQTCHPTKSAQHITNMIHGVPCPLTKLRRRSNIGKYDPYGPYTWSQEITQTHKMPSQRAGIHMLLVHVDWFYM